MIILSSFKSNNILHVGEYHCSQLGCNWQNFTKGIDWGFYNESDGNCDICHAKCKDDAGCRAFECGSSYCSWWAAGTCEDRDMATLISHTGYQTCRIEGIYHPFQKLYRTSNS